MTVTEERRPSDDTPLPDHGTEHREGRGSWPSKVLFSATIAWVVTAVLLLLVIRAGEFQIDSSVAHVALFAALGATALGYVRSIGRNGLVVWTALGIVGIAILTEFVQGSFVLGRSGEISDAVADVVGLAIGAVVLVVIGKVAPRRSNSLTAFTSVAALVVVWAIVLTTPSAGLTIAGPRTPECPALTDDQIDSLVDTLGEAAVFSFDGDSSTLTTLEGAETIEVGTPRDLSEAWCLAGFDGRFSVVIEATSNDPTQTGPSRIVTSSRGYESQDINFQVGQQEEDLVFRIRTASTGMNEFVTPGVFADSAPKSIAVVFDRGLVEVYVDGDLLTNFESNNPDVAIWDVDYPLVIGDEAIGGRAFDGTISTVKFFARELSGDEVGRECTTSGCSN